MKLLCVFFAFFIALGSVLAQDEPAPDAQMPADVAAFVYSRAKEALVTKMPAKEGFPTLQPKNLPANMLDTLRKYDWVALGNYYYGNWTFSDDWSVNQNNFQVERYLPNGLHDYYVCSKTNSAPTLTFNYRPRIMNIRVEKIGQFHYIVNDKKGENSAYGRIISYQDGILVYDVTETGTLQDAATSVDRFRSVYLAIPKKF